MEPKSLTGVVCSAPVDRDVGISDPAVTVLSRRTCSPARCFAGERDVEGQVGGRWEVEGTEKGDQGISDGSRGPVVQQYMRTFIVRVIWSVLCGRRDREYAVSLAVGVHPLRHFAQGAC